MVEYSHKKYGGRVDGHPNTGNKSQAAFKASLDAKKKKQKEKDAFNEAHTIKPDYYFQGQKMDEKDYNIAVMAAKGNKGKIMPETSPALDQLRQTQEQQSIQSQAQANMDALAKQNKILQAQEALLPKEKTGGLINPKTGLMEGELPEYKPLEKPQDNQPTVADYVFPIAPQSIEKNVGSILDEVVKNEDLVRGISSAAQILNKISGFLPAEWRFGESKSTEVKAAEAQFLDASLILDEDIKMVESGMIDWTTVQSDIDDAIEQIYILESQNHGINLLDNRYWLTQGKELAVQIEREKKILESKSIKLLEARAKAQASQSTRNYGL